MLWNTRNILRNLDKRHEYGKVILPMTIIKRLHDTLLPTQETVLEAAKQHENMNVPMEIVLCQKHQDTLFSIPARKILINYLLIQTTLKTIFAPT